MENVLSISKIPNKKLNLEIEENTTNLKKSEKPKINVDNKTILLNDIADSSRTFYNRIKVSELNMDIEKIFKDYFSSEILNNELDKDIHQSFQNYGK